jgi:hypothetical protein
MTSKYENTSVNVQPSDPCEMQETVAESLLENSQYLSTVASPRAWRTSCSEFLDVFPNPDAEARIRDDLSHFPETRSPVFAPNRARVDPDAC